MKNTFAILSLILISVLFYSVTLRGDFGNPRIENQTGIEQLTKAAGPFESSHERASYAQYLAFTKNKKFSLSKELGDFASPDVGYYNDKFFSYFPPGVSLIITPLAALGERYNLEQVLGYASISIVAVFSLILIYLISKNVFHLPKNLSILSALMFGFATPAWFYSISIYQHAVNAFLMLIIFYLSWLGKKQKNLKWITAILIGFFYGASMLFDYPNLILLMPAVIYFLATNFSFAKDNNYYRFKINSVSIALFIILAAVALVPQFYMNYVQFGNPLQFTNTLPRHIIEPIQEVEALDLTETEASEVEGESQSKSRQVFNEFNLVKGFYVLTVAPDKGLFFFSPILILGLFGGCLLLRKFTWEAFFLISSLVLNISLYASFGDPWGGWAYGARYLVPSMAILSIFSGIWIGRFSSGKVLKSIIFILLVFSCATALLGALTTGLTPPKVEADFLGIKYGLAYNYDFLINSQSSSFVYNNFLSNYMNLKTYFALLLLSILSVMLVLLMKFKAKENNLDKFYYGN